MSVDRKARAIYHEALEQILNSSGEGAPGENPGLFDIDHVAVDKRMPDGSERRVYRVKISAQVEIGLHDASLNPKWRGRW